MKIFYKDFENKCIVSFYSNIVLVKIQHLCQYLSRSGLRKGYWIKIVSGINRCNHFRYSFIGTDVSDKGKVWIEKGKPIVLYNNGRLYLISWESMFFELVCEFDVNDNPNEMWDIIDRMIDINKKKYKTSDLVHELEKHEYWTRDEIADWINEDKKLLFLISEIKNEINKCR